MKVILSSRVLRPVPTRPGFWKRPLLYYRPLQLYKWKLMLLEDKKAKWQQHAQWSFPSSSSSVKLLPSATYAPKTSCTIPRRSLLIKSSVQTPLIATLFLTRYISWMAKKTINKFIALSWKQLSPVQLETHLHASTTRSHSDWIMPKGHRQRHQAANRSSLQSYVNTPNQPPHWGDMSFCHFYAK